MRPRPGPGHRLVALVAILAVSAAVVAPAPAPAAAAPAGPPARYRPPVDAPVHDGFRAPPNPYAAGNRGIDYATSPGTEVRAAAGGEVTFAGPVGGELHVVVLHADGLRTSYSFLATTTVVRGSRVAPGEVVGTSGASLHFGARAGDRYVDPALLLAGGPASVHLVPVEVHTPQPPGVERRWLAGALLAARAGAATGAWLVDRGAQVGAEAVEVAGEVAGAAAARRLAAPVALARATVDARRAMEEVLADQEGCTAAHAPLPPPPPTRRVVVLVAGYGSSGGDADVLDVDTGALGYDPADRVQFSYAGGRVPGVGALPGVAVSGYGPADAMGDLEVAGRRLAGLLDDIAAAHPGVPVDVVAHSQGGLVARQALAPPEPDVRPGALAVEHLVTLGTPHRGAALATVAGTLGLRDRRSALGTGLALATGGGVDPRAAAVAQLAEGSAFLDALDERSLPAHLTATSVAAVGDLVVPASSSTLAGATNALVPLAGLTAHGRLPGSPEAGRALALALAGRGPACASAAAVVAGAAVAAAVGAGERLVGDAAAPSVVLADRALSWAAAEAG